MLVGLVLTSLGCSSGHTASPFSKALNVLCEVPEIRTARNVEVVDKTTSVLQLPALRDRFDPSPLTGETLAALTRAEDELLRHFRSERFAVPDESACRWQIAQDRYSDVMRVELSGVVPKDTVSNPSAGLFVRVSYGGRSGADFYWLPIDARGRIGKPMKLSVNDG